ncbi:hypothetical protein HAZT_HAZT007033, partial [Hyalella azteca]
MTNVSQEAELEWSATVALHVESPCEVVIEIKEPIVQGKPSGSLDEQLTRYPLRAVMLDGVFEEICVDQDDPKVAVNIKKGILSMLQNSLPSNSSLNDGIKASEMDVIGICPTVYNVKHDGDKVVVKKSKDHRLCSQRYGDGSESPLSAIPLKSVIPMRSSQSECVQEIQGGLFKTVTCRDDNEIAPILGVGKSVAAQQNSKLTLKKTMRTEAVRQIKNARKTSLLYDFTSEPKNASAVSEMELKLKGLCAVIEKGSVTMQTAQMFSDLISAMDDVEEPAIYEVWKNIKSKKYCSQSDDLEAIYLDAIPATENHGAVKVMAENILNKQRLFQYTWRLQTLKRVCSNGVAAVQPLLEDDDLPSFVTLAVGTVVKTYCSTEGRQYDGTCRMDEKLQRLMQTVSQRLTSSCTQASNDRKHEKTAVILLKTVGNMKNISDVLRPTVKECFSDSKVPLRVRLQAAEVLKNTKLSREDIEEMLGIATDKSEKTELRIFAYKTAVLSASKTELGHLITKITSQEYNDQALGLKLNTTIHSSSDVIVSAKVNLPSSLSFKLNFPQDNAEAFRFENRGYLMTKLPYERERALPPSTLNDPRIKAENVCYSSVAGLKMCSDYNVADLWAKTDYPLVAPSYIRTTIKKENPSIEGFEVSLTEKSESDGYSMKIEIPGSENPTKMAAEIGFSEQQDRKVLKLKSRVEENVHSLEMVITSKNQGIKLRQLEIYFGVGSSPPEKVLTGKCSRSDEGKLEVALKTMGALRSSQGEEVASIKGPFTWVRSQGSLHQKSHLGIRISGPESRSYHVDTEIDISSNKNKVLFTINKAQQLLISYQHDVSGNYESGLSAMSKIEIPEKIKTDFKLEKSSSHVQSDGEVKLEVYSPHHLQYQVSVDRSGSPHQPEGKFSAKIYLDKIRDPEHNVQLSGTYMLEDNSHFSLRGDARIARESYHYALTSSLEGQQSWRNIDKHVKLQIMKESEEFLTLLSSQKFHLEPQHSLELDSELSLVTPSKKEYYLKKQLEVSHEDSATQIKNSFTSHVTDIGEFKSTFSLNSHYQPDLALQLEGELSSSGLNEAQPALQINYKTDLEMSPSSLRRLDAAMNCDISGEKLNVQVSESESDREASLKVLKNDRTILFAHILREEQDGRQKMVVGKFSSGDASTNGHVSFDVFPHSEEAINIKVNATRLGDDMMRYEASVLSSSDVADGPRVVMDVTAADHEKALLVAYRSNLESAPSSLLAAKYIKQSQQSGIVSVLLKTQNKKFEIGGVLKKEHTIGCQGYNLNTTVLSPSDKTYALQIETCSPAFIKVITGAKDAPEEKYVIKAGVKSMTHAELSLTKNMRVPASGWVKKWSGSEFEQKEVPVAAVAAKLVGSQTLALKAQYDQDILAPTK